MRLVAALAFAACAVSAHATLRQSDWPDTVAGQVLDSTGQGSELWMSAYDPVAQVSYTLDLGRFMDEFWNTAQQDAGYQKFWIIDPAIDKGWSDYLGRASIGDTRWAVLAVDGIGPATPGGRRTYMTMQQGTEATLFAWSNANLSSSQGAALRFIDDVNGSGTHGGNGRTAAEFAINGSSFNDALDSTLPSAYFGDFVAGAFGQNGSLQVTNQVGKSSWFYYVTRSATSGTAKVRIDEFDNLGADGYFGFAQETGTARYLLSYTLTAFVSPGEAASGVTFGSSFARMAGVLSLSSAAGKGDTVLSLTEGFLRGLAGQSAAASTSKALDLSASRDGLVASAVPEPSTWALSALGAIVVLGAVRFRSMPA